MSPNNITYEIVRDTRHALSETDPFHAKVHLMWMAMTDWPVAVPDTDTFLTIMHKEVRRDLKQKSIEIRLKEYGQLLGVARHAAWKCETFTELLELFMHYPEAETLEEVVGAFGEEMRG